MFVFEKQEQGLNAGKYDWAGAATVVAIYLNCLIKKATPSALNRVRVRYTSVSALFLSSALEEDDEKGRRKGYIISSSYFVPP